MGLPPKVLRKGITDMVRISDARMSGTAYGTVVLHTSPEAARGGPLAVVQDRRHDRARRAGAAAAPRHLRRGARAPPRGLDAAGRAAGRRLRAALPRPRRRAPTPAPTSTSSWDAAASAVGAGIRTDGRRVPVALVGVGKIARDQHIPAIAADPDFELVAAVSRNAAIDGVPNFTDIDRLPRRRPAGRRRALRAAGGAHRDGAEGAGGRARRAAREAAGRDARRGRAAWSPPPAPAGAVPLRHLALALRPGGGRRRRPGSPAAPSARVAHRLEGGRAPLASRAGLDLAARRLRRLRPRHQRALAS